MFLCPFPTAQRLQMCASGRSLVSSVNGCGGLLKEEAQIFLLLCLKLERNEDSRTTEGMVGNFNVPAAVLTVMSVLSLSLLSIFCLRCKKKSRYIHEEHQIYNPQMLETRNQFEEIATEEIDEQSNYENITEAHTGCTEHTYVAPLPIIIYENDWTETGTNLSSCVYGNVNDDDDDYENSEFLKEQEEEEEPDYVNEDSNCT
ncbi:LAT2 domain-containing protein isoform X3 [Labrus bergylta]|uniref:LAT2 domain-containing protein isoform X3 n=1 Tax=Labrus bergylta TaxID=56723 RepID=UPI00331445FB